MCINWIALPDGNMRPCHVCWQCKRDRVNDWVGRCMAEAETSASTLRVTLTYGTDPNIKCDHAHAYDLYYDDVQKYLKLLRKYTAGRVRFFCTGEFGSKKGRAHWHLILFYSGEVTPNVKFEERFMHEIGNGGYFWPHGWSYWELADAEKMRYAIKYILKDNVEGHYRVHRSSKVPEIGHYYFKRLAWMAVKQGVPPRSSYRFPNDWNRRGEPREYRLTRSALYSYLAAYSEMWFQLYGDENWPQSDLMDAFVDERARRRRRDAGEADMTAQDWARRFELERRERRLNWALMTKDEETGDAPVLYPRRENRYRKVSEGE